MDRTRIKLAVYVDLDPIPGAFHSADNAQHHVRNMLNEAIPHYNPAVSIESYDSSEQHGEQKSTAIVIKAHETESYNAGPGRFCAVAKDEEAAKRWIQDEVDRKHGETAYMQGKDADWWIEYGAFSLTEVEVVE